MKNCKIDRKFYEEQFESTLNEILDNKKDIFDWLMKRCTLSGDITIHINPAEVVTWELKSVHYAKLKIDEFNKKETNDGKKKENRVQIYTSQE